MSDLRAELIRLAQEKPELRAHLVPLLRGAKDKSTKDVKPPTDKKAPGGTFSDFIKARKFRNPETGNKVTFGALPKGQQKKIREHFGQGQDGADDDKGEGKVRQHLAQYNMEIVGDNESRAKYIATKLEEGIAASADICKMTPPVCEGNLGISRSNMPQVMDVSIKELLDSDDPKDRKKGQAAVDAGADPDNGKPLMGQLIDSMKESGTKVTKEKVSVGQLKATQREIKAGKSFGMADAYYKGKFDPAADVEIVISSDNHILDGHHRWASLLVSDPDREMKVIRVDKPMREFLKESLDYPGVFRADLQDNVISKDTPLDLNEGGEEKGSGEKKKKEKDESKDKPKKEGSWLQFSGGSVA